MPHPLQSAEAILRWSTSKNRNSSNYIVQSQLLVMDEATSALDFDTERQLCLNLQEWANGKTVFFITHRLSTIRNSDLILVMHKVGW